MSVTVKKNEDLDAAVGKALAKVIKGFRKDFMKRLPSGIRFTEAKPKFYLDDGGMLRVFAVNLATGEVLGERYMGSGDTAANNPSQFDEGHQAPENHALMFVETYPSTGNHPWYLTVVSPNVVKQIEAVKG